MKKIVYLAIFALLSACASIMSIDYEGADAGYVVVGIGGAKESALQAYGLIIKDASGARGRLMYIHRGMLSDKPDYDSESEEGIVKVVSLKAGKYELCNYYVSEVVPPGEVMYAAPQDFSIPFEVQPGQTIYLGNFNAEFEAYENFAGMTRHRWMGFRVRDRTDRDIEIAQKKNPRITFDAFKNVTPEPGKLSDRFF